MADNVEFNEPVEPIIDNFDLIFLCILGACTLLYFYRDTLFGSKKEPVDSQVSPTTTLKPAKPKKSKDFIKKMKETDKNVVMFFGSQTGTAEDYASRLAKEGQQRFGEPTDDAVEFWDLINSETPEFSKQIPIEDKPLSNLRFVIFGLGNKTYEHFNEVGKRTNAKFIEFGAKRIGEPGEGDDDGSLEEDFLGWKEDMWKAVCDEMGIDQNEVQSGARIPTYNITELEDCDIDQVYFGEHSEHALISNSDVPYDQRNPYPSKIINSRELFNSSDRNCIHMEFDIKDSGITYQSGDHVAIWPINPEQEVYRLLKVLGLWEKKDTIVTVESTDPSASKKHPFPVPTTYATIFRYYLDIHTPASRQFLATLASYAPTEEGKSKLTILGQDKETYKTEVMDAHLTLGEILEDISPNGKPLDTIPLDLIIETLPRLQSRYYSISSSPKVTPDTIHITASILTFNPISKSQKTVYGLATNYIHQVHRKLRNIQHPDNAPYYLYNGPRNKYYEEDNNNIKFAIHVRRSNFKLPKNPKTPIVMVGPGTGVAPFRGFIIERAKYKEEGYDLGDTVLFFGCRNSNIDFLYKNEFEELFNILGENSKLITAFSREQESKVYVQHRLLEHQKYIWDLIYTRAAQSCGEMSEEDATVYIKDLRSQGRYQEDVWS
ncbi:11060_t:CDS:2 [Diversispora eburnea]|uniref:NADPH--hemoprotein reductase n=1 Tax=Diversispora eburnea TaxID=1213867 RepID=A0A9N9AA66_9GLOM|nr:11060_t:CDS:2 [Diversispora eburnea]